MLITAHQLFKGRHPRILAVAGFATLILITGTFLYCPVFRVDPYRLPDEVFTALIPPPEIIVPPAPKDIPMPKMVTEIVPVDGEGDTDDVPISNLDLVPDIPPPTRTETQGPQPFVAVDQIPELTYKARVNYPELAQEAEMEGQVIVLVGLDERGKVIEASILSSNVHSLLENAALDAAWRCRFSPGRQRNIAVRTRAVIPFDFRLKR